MATQLTTVQLQDINIRRLLFVRRFMVISVVMAVVAICMVLFAIMPQAQQIVETRSTIAQENATLQNLQRKIVGLTQVNDLVEYAQRDKVDAALPVQKPLLALLDSARRVSAESGARIMSIETAPGKLASVSAQRSTATPSLAGPEAVPPAPVPLPTTASDGQVHGVDKMDIAVVIQGNIDQISAFVSLIEQSTPITNVTELQITDLLATTSGPSEFSAELRLSSYYFTRAIEVAVDSPLPETGVRERAFLQELEQYTVTPPVVQSQQVEGGGREDLFGFRQ